MTEPRKIARYGWIPDQPDQRDSLYAAPAQFLTALPSQADLTPCCPEVYNQGALGTCTANAIGGAIEFDRMKQRLTDLLPSPLFIYYNERAIMGTVGMDSGAQLRVGLPLHLRFSRLREVRGRRGEEQRPRDHAGLG